MNLDSVPQFVYIAKGQQGTKIGITRSLESRMQTLRASHYKSFYLPEKARRVEIAAHKLVGVKPVHGNEWFDVPLDDAVLAVENAMVDEGVSAKLRGPPVLPKNRFALGYIAVGFYLPTLDAQIDALRAVGVKGENTYIDQWDNKRPFLHFALDVARPGDYFIVSEMRVLAKKPKDQASVISEVIGTGAKFMLA